MCTVQYTVCNFLNINHPVLQFNAYVRTQYREEIQQPTNINNWTSGRCSPYHNAKHAQKRKRKNEKRQKKNQLNSELFSFGFVLYTLRLPIKIYTQTHIQPVRRCVRVVRMLLHLFHTRYTKPNTMYTQNTIYAICMGSYGFLVSEDRAYFRQYVLRTYTQDTTQSTTIKIHFKYKLNEISSTYQQL